jgi:hypothetical protein
MLTGLASVKSRIDSSATESSRMTCLATDYRGYFHEVQERQFRDWYLGCGQMALDHSA